MIRENLPINSKTLATLHNHEVVSKGGDIGVSTAAAVELSDRGEKGTTGEVVLDLS